MSNAILDCIGFALLCSVIGPENSRHFISQSQRGYSRFPALQRVGLFLFWVVIGSFRYFPQFWLAGDDTMVLVLRYSIMWSHSQPSFCSTSIIPQSRNSVMARYKKNHLPKLNSRLRNCSLSESGWGIERLLLDLALCNLERENF